MVRLLDDQDERPYERGVTVPKVSWDESLGCVFVQGVARPLVSGGPHIRKRGLVKSVEIQHIECSHIFICQGKCFGLTPPSPILRPPPFLSEVRQSMSDFHIEIVS